MHDTNTIAILITGCFAVISLAAAIILFSTLSKERRAGAAFADALRVELKKSEESAHACRLADAVSEQKLSAAESQLAVYARKLEIAELELQSCQRQLIEASAKVNSDESAARQLEFIGQKVLNESLDKAVKTIDEITLQHSHRSKDELNRHAESVTKTLEPLQQKLSEYEKAIAGMRTDTSETYGGLREQLIQLQKTERSLHDQAKALTTALSASPKMRGSYGELQLKQIVEFAGMQQYCHFELQNGTDSENGRKIPDMVVNLPGGQKVIVDAKAVMEACVQALQCTDDSERTALIRKHCENVRSRILDLSSKTYYHEHRNAVEAVVLFLPAEYLYNAAMENDPELTEYATSKKIIVCGPNSLIMLLTVANSVWKRAAIEVEANNIVKVGGDVYKAACDFVSKYSTVGIRIQQLSAAYNDAGGTLDQRLITSARKMGKFRSIADGGDIGDNPVIGDALRSWRSEEAKASMVSETARLELVTDNNTTPGLSSDSDDQGLIR